MLVHKNLVHAQLHKSDKSMYMRLVNCNENFYYLRLAKITIKINKNTFLTKHNKINQSIKRLGKQRRKKKSLITHHNKKVIIYWSHIRLQA